MVSSSKLAIDKPTPCVLRVLINRPDKRNAIDYDVRQQLIETVTQVLADGETRALVLGGVGGHFSAGGDLPSMVGLSKEEARHRMQHIARLCRLVYSIGIPVVTAMEGFSAGACVGLALLGDYIVVGNNTKVLFPFMTLGLVPDWGTLYTLPRRVGWPAAQRVLSAAEPITGAEARQISLADELVADAEIMSTAVHRASRLAALPQDAFSRMKRRLTRVSGTLDEELGREEEDQTELLRSADFHEGYTAFVEKRIADFAHNVTRQTRKT